MSFTAEVKEELARVEAKPCCAHAELSALVRVEGTLHYTGGGRMRLEIATETAPVARKVIKLLRAVFDLTTELTVRRSVLHKSNNYLITVVDQPKLHGALIELGILIALTVVHGHLGLGLLRGSGEVSPGAPATASVSTGAPTAPFLT